MVTKTSRHLIVVAYDISDNKQRSKVAQILEQYGKRINLSVFECMMTSNQFEKVSKRIGLIINKRTDYVVYYPICKNCYTKVIYQIPQERVFCKVTVV